MTDRPILFSAPMIRALLDGTKIQTRRLIKNMPEPFEVAPGQLCEVAPSQIAGESPARIRLGRVITTTRLPYGLGDRLWVRETWRPHYLGDGVWNLDVTYAADGHRHTIYDGDFGDKDWTWPKAADRGNVSPLFMPRWASRITLLVEDLRIQTLQDISDTDASAEGVEADSDGWRDYLMPATQCCGSARDSFASLWDSLNAARAPWDSNPWVVAVSFRVECCNIDKVAV